MTRKTGIPSSRQKSIAFGRVHGLSGWPDSVWSGGGPDRSRPVNRRLLTSGLIARKPSGSRQAAPEGGDLLRRVLEQHRRVLPAPPDLHLHLAGTERALADGDAQGAPEELGVGELLPRSCIAIVVEHVEPELLELAVEPVREGTLLGAILAHDDELDVERRHRTRPGDAALVGVLLDRSGGGPRGPEPIRAHPDELLAARFVEVGGAQGLGVAGAELEDVAYLDGRLDPDRAAVDGVSGHHGADIDGLVVEVATRLDAAEVRIGLVGARHVAARRDAGGEEDRHLGADRAYVPWGTEPRRDLVGMSGTEVGTQRVAQLDLVDAMVPPEHHEAHLVTVENDRKSLEEGTGRDAQGGRDRVDRRHAGSRDDLGSRECRPERHGLRVGARHLEVRRVSPGQGHLVLAGWAGGHVLVRAA